MAYRNGAAYGFMDLLLALKGFLESSELINNIVYTGATGNGYISGERCADAATNETWTITFSSSTAFSVSGSVSGSQGSGTVGTEFTSTNTNVTFTVIAGGTAFAVSDVITFDVASGLETQKWAVNEWADSDIDGSPDKQLLIEGPGTSASDEIYCGIRTFRDSGSNRYNWELQGFTGYNAVSTWLTQPGRLTYGKYIYLDDNTKTYYWMKASGRRFILVTNISGVYDWLYMGFILPFGNPNEFPYPLLIGGSGAYDTYNFSSGSGTFHSAFWSGCRNSSHSYGPAAFWIGLDWLEIANFYNTDQSASSYTSEYGKFWPIVQSVPSCYLEPHFYTGSMTLNADGLTYPMFPFILKRWKDDGKAIFGELDGMFWIPGDGLSPEDEFTLATKDYIVLPDTFRRENWSFAAFLKE